MKNSIIYLLILVLIFGVSASSSFGQQANKDSAVIISVVGEVKVDPEATDEWIAAKVGTRLVEGAKLKIGDRAYAKIAFDKEKLNIITMTENTTLSLDLISESAYRVGLPTGKIIASLKNLATNAKFEIKTPSGVCGVRGSMVEVEVTDEGTDFFAIEGNVFANGMDDTPGPISIIAGNTTATVTAGEGAQVVTDPDTGSTEVTSTAGTIQTTTAGVTASVPAGATATIVADPVTREISIVATGGAVTITRADGTVITIAPGQSISTPAAPDAQISTPTGDITVKEAEEAEEPPEPEQPEGSGC